MENVTKEQWKELIAADENAVILDVRTAGECSEGIQPNAIMLDIMNASAFMAGVQEMDKSKSYYVYCRSGNRSGQACSIMEQAGFKTFNLIGGMMMWDGETTQMS